MNNTTKNITSEPEVHKISDVSSKQLRRRKTVESILTNRIKPGLKGRKSMRHLSISHVERAMSRMTGMQALKFLHPRRLRKQIINKHVPTGTYEPQG